MDGAPRTQVRQHLAVAVPAALLALFFPAIAVAALVSGDESLPRAVAATTPTASAAPAPAPTPTPTPTRAARTPAEVLAATSFVRDYRAAQPQITRMHADAGLAADGLDMCAMTADPQVTLADMRQDFVREDHPHNGPHQQHEQIATQVFALAVRDICPDLTPAWRTKQTR